MQEVFENIITNLENEVLKSSGNMTRTYAFEKAIEIVKQEAAEYNNRWIPISERLPEECEDVEVAVEEIADEVGGKRHYTMRTWLQDGQWVIKKNPYHPTVIAWKYPTEPYQTKGE